MVSSSSKNRSDLHLQVLFKCMSDAEGWVTWNGMATLTDASGERKSWQLPATGKDGYLNILSSLQGMGYQVTKDDLQVNVDALQYADAHGFSGPADGIGVSVFILEKNIH